MNLDLGRRQADYVEIWGLQRQIHANVVAGTLPPTVILVEHTSVYTAGKRTAPWDRPQDDTPVIDVDRGGRITWHGPGQLVAYPILPLPDPVDVVRYVRALEEALIHVCAEFNIVTTRVEGRSGVWITAGEGPDRKIAAIGVRVSRGVTMHGIALNCNSDLSPFNVIVPCGISDAAVTSLTQETGTEITITDVAPVFTKHLSHALAYAGINSMTPDADLTLVAPSQEGHIA